MKFGGLVLACLLMCCSFAVAGVGEQVRTTGQARGYGDFDAMEIARKSAEAICGSAVDLVESCESIKRSECKEGECYHVVSCLFQCME